MLRKVFMKENLCIGINEEKQTFTDHHPRYSLELGSCIDGLYLGNTFYEQAITYQIHYWSEEDCNEHFFQFVEELETFRQFVQDYFIALDGILRFNISNDEESLLLSDETKYNFMNYNMNI